MKSRYSKHLWRDITKFNIDDRGNKAIISFNYLAKNHSYEVHFDDTKFLSGNRKRFLELKEKFFYKEKIWINKLN